MSWHGCGSHENCAGAGDGCEVDGCWEVMLMLILARRRVEFGGENDARSRGDFHVSQILDKKLLALRERSMFGFRWCYAK
jgi:hypothetical protein